MFLPLTMRHFIDVASDRLALAARALQIDGADGPDEQAARALADHVARLIAAAGINDRLADYGVEENDLPAIADMAMSDGSIIYSPKPVFDPEEIVGLLRQAL